MLIRGKHIVCSNVGDSRAVIGYIRKGIPYPLQLSVEHTTNVQSEVERIRSNGGRICPCLSKHGDEGPPRVWLKNIWTPGLTKTRTFGDLVASTIGVNSDPQILTHKVKREDRFLIIASHAIWE